MILERIEQWFASKCDGDWEHQGGLSIETSDNPGWCVTITFDDTPHRSGPGVEGRNVLRSETDFVTFLYDDAQKTLRITCGALNLSEALAAFLEVEGEEPS